MLTHIVFFKLHDRSPENKQKFHDVLESLRGKVPQIREMQVGVNILESARAYDVALFQKFDSVETMQEYQSHPEHQAILPFLRANFESSASVDYES